MKLGEARSTEEIVKDIESVLKDKVAPSVAAHNGKIKFISFLRGVVRLLSKITLERGVEQMLKHYVPEVQAIVGEDDEKAEEQGYTPYLPKNEEPDWKKLVRE